MSNPWALLMLAITAEVLGTSCLRLSEGMTKPLPTVLVFSAYAIAMALLSKVVLSNHSASPMPSGVALAPSPSCWWAGWRISKRCLSLSSSASG